MVESNPTAAPSIDLTPVNSLLSNGSPKGAYVYFLLSACKSYLEVMRGDGSASQVHDATMALIAMCPNREKRYELWRFYLKDVGELKKEFSSLFGDGGATVHASTFVIGELISYLSEVLEFTEDSTGGFL
jgi:hypothetical protein